MRNAILAIAFVVVFAIGFIAGAASPLAGLIEAHAEQQRITNEQNR